MVMGGPRRGKKRWHFSPESKIANEKSTIFSSSGFFHVKKDLGLVDFVPILCPCFSCVFPVFMTKIYKNPQRCGICVPFSHYSTCYKRQFKSQCCHRSSSRKRRRPWLSTPYLTKKNWAWKKMAWKFPSVIFSHEECHNVNVWILLVPNFERHPDV